MNDSIYVTSNLECKLKHVITWLYCVWSQRYIFHLVCKLMTNYQLQIL